MRWAILLIFFLASCSEPESAKLERQLEMMEKAGASKSEMCAKQREVAEAYLREENREEYDLKKLTADVACNAAVTERL